MRIHFLKKIALLLGILGFGTALSALVVRQQIPRDIRQFSMLLGLLGISLAIGLEVIAVLALRRRRRIRNGQWIDAFHRISKERMNSTREGEGPSPKITNAEQVDAGNRGHG